MSLSPALNALAVSASPLLRGSFLEGPGVLLRRSLDDSSSDLVVGNSNNSVCVPPDVPALPSFLESPHSLASYLVLSDDSILLLDRFSLVEGFVGLVSFEIALEICPDS